MAKAESKKAEKAIVEKAPIKAPVEKAATKAKAVKGPGVISTIIETISKRPATKQEILDVLCKRFPDRAADGMKATVSIQLGPTRLGSKFKLHRDGDKFHIAG